DLFALSRKVHSIDDTYKLTDEVSKTLQTLRQPLVRSLTAAAKRGDEVAKAADNSDANQLQEQRRELDALTAGFKQVSTLVVPLGRQSILLDLYKKNLTSWRDSVRSEYSVELKGLIVRIATLALALVVVLILGQVWRKATFKYVKDIRRRYQFLL